MDRERRGIGGGSQWLAARHNDGRTSALTFSTCASFTRESDSSTCSADGDSARTKKDRFFDVYIKKKADLPCRFSSFFMRYLGVALLKFFFLL